MERGTKKKCTKNNTKITKTYGFESVESLPRAGAEADDEGKSIPRLLEESPGAKMVSPYCTKNVEVQIETYWRVEQEAEKTETNYK